MPARRCRLTLAYTLAGLLVAPCDAGVRPTVFISADVRHGGASNADVTYTFHMSEVPGGTAACTGRPTHRSEAGTMTAALTLSEEASLEMHYYVGWSIKITGGGGVGGTGTITTYDALTRVITAAGVGSTAAGSTYELTAGTCAATFVTKGAGTCVETATTSVPVDAAACAAVTALSTNTACAAVTLAAGGGSACTYTASTIGVYGMWSNCPAGCDFVGPIVDPSGYHKFVSGPLPCTTVAVAGSKATLLCPLNTVAAAEQPLADISVKRQTIQTTAALTAAAVGQSLEIRDTVVTGTMGAALTLAAASGADAYYAGWRIETEFPKASGTVLTYTDASKLITVAWDEPTACDTGFNKNKTTCTPVTTTAATTYTLTADCPAAPKNVPLVVQAKADASTPFIYQFAPGSLTRWAPVTGTPIALDRAKCTVHRSVDGLYSAHVPAGAFTDAGGNPNMASTACRDLTSAVVTAYGDGANAATVIETAAGAALCNLATPYQVTSDVTVPTVTVTASDDNWMSSVASAGLANGDRITFKFVLSEPPIKTTAAAAFALPAGPAGGGDIDGDLTTGHLCANPVSWGTVSQLTTY